MYPTPSLPHPNNINNNNKKKEKSHVYENKNPITIKTLEKSFSVYGNNQERTKLLSLNMRIKHHCQNLSHGVCMNHAKFWHMNYTAIEKINRGNVEERASLTTLNSALKQQHNPLHKLKAQAHSRGLIITYYF